jgi:hypothetical protein
LGGKILAMFLPHGFRKKSKEEEEEEEEEEWVKKEGG